MSPPASACSARRTIFCTGHFPAAMSSSARTSLRRIREPLGRPAPARRPPCPPSVFANLKFPVSFSRVSRFYHTGKAGPKGNLDHKILLPNSVPDSVKGCIQRGLKVPHQPAETRQGGYPAKGDAAEKMAMKGFNMPSANSYQHPSECGEAHHRLRPSSCQAMAATRPSKR